MQITAGGIINAMQALFGRTPPKPVVAPPVVDEWVPTFEHPIGYGPYGVTTRFMNPEYFATEPTAVELMKKFGAKEVRKYVSPGNEGPLYTCSEPERWLVWGDGFKYNAGQLAAIYTRFKGAMADEMASLYLEMGRRAWFDKTSSKIVLTEWKEATDAK